MQSSNPTKSFMRLVCVVVFLQIPLEARAQNCDEIIASEFCTPGFIWSYPPWPSYYFPSLPPFVFPPFNMPDPEGERQDPDRPNFPEEISGRYGNEAEVGLRCLLNNFRKSPYLKGILKDYSDVDISIVMTRSQTSCGNTAACVKNAEQGKSTRDIVRTKDGSAVVEINSSLVESRRTDSRVGVATRQQVLAADILHEIGHVMLPGGGDHTGVINGRMAQVPETHPDFPNTEMGKYMQRAWSEMFPGTLPPEVRVGKGQPPATLMDISQCFGGLKDFNFNNIRW